MMKIVIPILLALLGFVGGAGAAWFLKPPPEPEAEVCLDEHGQEMTGEACAADEEAEDAHAEEEHADSEFVQLERQFIVPVVSEDRVSSMMVLSLNLEVEPGTVEAVFQKEPKLRDALLRALFEHAYTGGFSGDFTAEHVMRELRRNLKTAAQGVVGPTVRDVLVSDIIKQDQ
jgi:flagellar basal body-associated protein FliL